MSTYYFEDFAVGDRYTSRTYTVTAEEITTFGRKYDPQAFHVDPEAAAESRFGGLIASGLHLVAICGRLSVDAIYGETEIVAGLGMDRVRFLDAVSPGTDLHIVIEVSARRDSKSYPDCGLISLYRSMYDSTDTKVLTMSDSTLVRRRE
jgi:acyl dehydratase